MTTVTWTMAEWAAELRYQDLPAEVVRQCKRFLMDSVGCALGGAQQHDVQIARKVIGEIAGAGPATVLDRMFAAVERAEQFEEARRLMAELTIKKQASPKRSRARTGRHR